MDFYLSTIADVDFEVAGETEIISYKHNTLPVAQEYGLGLELAEFCISENLDGEKYNAILPFFNKNAQGVTKKVLHAPYNELYPMAVDPMVVEVAHKRYKQSYDICKQCGASKMIVHANYVQRLYYPQWFKVRQIEFWKRFLEENPGIVQIVIENVQEETPDMITDIVAGVDDPRFKMCLDIGHANLMPVKVEDWIKECAPYTSHYHIHNNKGPVGGDRPSLGDTHSALDNGIMDMEKLLKMIEKLTPDASLSLETTETERSCRWLKEKGFI